MNIPNSIVNAMRERILLECGFPSKEIDHAYLSEQEVINVVYKYAQVMVQGIRNGYLIAFIDPKNMRADFRAHTINTEGLRTENEILPLAIRLLETSIDQWRYPIRELALLNHNGQEITEFQFPFRPDL